MIYSVLIIVLGIFLQSVVHLEAFIIDVNLSLQYSHYLIKFLPSLQEYWLYYKQKSLD